MTRFAIHLRQVNMRNIKTSFSVCKVINSKARHGSFGKCDSQLFFVENSSLGWTQQVVPKLDLDLNLNVSD